MPPSKKYNSWEQKMKICLAGRCRQERMLCSRTFLGWDKQENRQCPNPAEIPNLLHFGLSSAISTFCPQTLAVHPTSKGAKGAETPRLWCHNSKSLYPIHLNNLALPGALQQTASKWNWESQNKLSAVDKATHHGQVQVSWTVLRTKHQIVEAAQINLRASKQSSFRTKSWFPVTGLQLTHPLVAHRRCFSWTSKPDGSFSPSLQIPLSPWGPGWHRSTKNIPHVL